MKQQLEDEMHSLWQINDIWLEKIEILFWWSLTYKTYVPDMGLAMGAKINDEYKTIASTTRCGHCQDLFLLLLKNHLQQLVGPRLDVESE